MVKESGISRWQGVIVVLALSILGLGNATSAETDQRRWDRPNQSPVISGTAPTGITAGQWYSFRPNATDADGDRLSFWIQNKPRWAKFDSRSGELRGTSNQPGTYPNVVIGVSDWKTSDALPPFTIEIGAQLVDQPPVISGSPPPAVVAEHAYAFQPSAADPEGARLSFAVQNRPIWASFDASTGNLSGTPTSANVGTYGNIVISATDGTSFASLEPFAIEVTPAPNAAPVISGSPATQVTAGQPYGFTPAASDADGDSLTFSVSNKPVWASFDAASGRLSGTPTSTQVGTTSNIVISVSDGQASAALPPFAIEVAAVPNRAPTISGSPSTSVTEAQSYSFTPAATDADGDVLIFSIQNRPVWTTFSASTGRLAGTPGSTHVGGYANIVISVSDGQTSAALPAFSIEVTAAPNRAPVIGGQPATTVVAGQAYAFTPSASDADGDVLSFAIAGKPAWAAFDASTGRLSGTPSTAQVGTYPGIVISVTDGTTFSELAPFGITVTEAPNRAPTVAGTPASSVVAGQSYSFTPSASDADGDPLTFSIQNRPAWAAFSSSTGRLSGTPTSTHVGSYGNIVISVSDGVASASLAPFSVEVTAAPNRAPTISGQPATTVTAGQLYSFTPAASDPDGDVLTFSIQNRPAWATFSPTTGRLSGTPTTAGTHTNILIVVSDGKVSASLPAFTISVEQPATRSVTLSWQAPTLNEDGTPLTDLNGYVVHYGQSAGQYSETLSLPSAALTSVTIEDLVPATWYFAVKAVNSAGTQSSFSNEAWKTIN
jgi:large repetitive protein